MEKKTYETPSIEVVKFCYCDQVVAASSNPCTQQYIDTGDYTTKECLNPGAGYNRNN